MNIIAVIIAKADSRRLPKKNLKPFCGLPLVEWSIIQAKYSKYINKTYVVTNGQEVADVAEKHGARVVWQPQEEIDKAEAEGQMGGPYSINRGFVEANKEEIVNGMFCLLPTSPMRKVDDLDNCIEVLRQRDAYPILSMVAQKDMHLFKRGPAGAVSALFDNKGTYLRVNGSIYFVTPQQWLKYTFKEDGTFWKPQEIIAKQESGEFIYTPLLHEIWQLWDIDSQEDFDVCEYWMEKKILQGRGEEVYKEYHTRVLSEFGYSQQAAGYNKGVEMNLLPFEYRNSFFNHLPLFLESVENEEVASYELVEVAKTGDRKSIKKWFANSAQDCLKDKLKEPKAALIIGSGKSLDLAGPLLNRWKGATFCSTSQATTLVHYGLNPSHIVAYDINTQVEELSRIDTWAGRGCSLVTHPGVNPRLLDWWKEKKLLFRSMDTSNFFFQNVLPNAYQDIIPSQMFLFSCSISAQMSLAKAMGYDPLFFVGCDFADTRAMFSFFDDGVWKDFPGVPSTGAMKTITAANGKKTDAMKIFYKRSVMCVWRIDHAQCLLCFPERSIITEMPGVDFESVIAYQGEGFEKQFLIHSEIEDHAEVYLARFNQFIIKFREGGVKVVECAPGEWEPQVAGYIGALNTAGEQQGKPGLVDADWNLARFRALKEMADVVS